MTGRSVISFRLLSNALNGARVTRSQWQGGGLCQRHIIWLYPKKWDHAKLDPNRIGLACGTGQFKGKKQMKDLPLTAIEKDSEAVVLLHGLKRTCRSMDKAARILAGYGYRIINIGYPSTRQTVETSAVQCIGKAVEECEAAEVGKIHFLTHSLGGILVRYYLSVEPIPKLGRVVMLAPPNKGSEIVDKLGGWRLFYLMNGPAGLQLGTGHDSLPNRLGMVNFEAGVIAGDRTVNPLLSLLFQEANDGKVAVNRTQIEGMGDFIVLPYSHTFIMRREPVIRQALHFIQQGCFVK
jgi:triacylglycerol lipase